MNTKAESTNPASESSIPFSRERWAKIKRDSAAWWKGELDRPLVQLVVTGRDPGREPAALTHRHFTICHGPEVSAAEVVDSWDHMLSGREYLGDAFPAVWPNFGAGVLAAFLGCGYGYEAAGNTVWFHAGTEAELADQPLRFESGHELLRRIRAICAEASRRWQGLVQVGMTDLGGTLDVLQSFRPGESFLYDFYDCPETVREKTWSVHENWWQAFGLINSALRPGNPGYTCWAPIFSETPYYMLQCDFSYMIGPDMFAEFVLPELAASCRKLGNAFYHLDGVGELPHLDHLLAIPELKGIQWIPGAGKPEIHEWPEVLRKIHRAGKLLQIYASRKEGLRTLDRIADQLGTARGLVYLGETDQEHKDEALALLERFGVPVC